MNDELNAAVSELVKAIRAEHSDITPEELRMKTVAQVCQALELAFPAECRDMAQEMINRLVLRHMV